LLLTIGKKISARHGKDDRHALDSRHGRLGFPVNPLINGLTADIHPSREGRFGQSMPDSQCVDLV
jgi:hypothetical protein